MSGESATEAHLIARFVQHELCVADVFNTVYQRNLNSRLNEIC